MRILPALILALLPATVSAQSPQPVPVVPAAAAPAVDGDLSEWGRGGWVDVVVKPAVDKAERAKLRLDGEDRNATGTLTVALKAVAAGGRLYLAARWPDEGADLAYKGWEWRGDRYFESKQRDDMFAVRFHLAGDFDRSMLVLRDYEVDVWLWSAGRSNAAGLAEDMSHLVSARLQEDAAEYEIAGQGTVYIKKRPDAGAPIYRPVRPPKRREQDRLPSVELAGTASGSKADVAARGTWKAGFWHLELARALDTGHPDDRAFAPGSRVLGQIAVFNKGHAEHKSVSDLLMFDFQAVR